MEVLDKYLSNSDQNEVEVFSLNFLLHLTVLGLSTTQIFVFSVAVEKMALVTSKDRTFQFLTFYGQARFKNISDVTSSNLISNKHILEIIHCEKWGLCL